MKKTLLLVLFVLLFAVLAQGQQQVPINSGVATLDTTQANYFKIFLNQNISVLKFSPLPASTQQIYVMFVQDGTGGRTITFGSNISSSCVVTSTANATTICSFFYDSGTATWYSAIGGASGGGGGGGLPTTPTSPNNVTYTLGCPVASSTCTAAWLLPAIIPRHVSGTTSTDTIASGDIGNTVVYDGSVAVATALPTPTTLGVAQGFLKLVNSLSTTNDVTITATTLTFQSTGTTSLVIHQNQSCFLTVQSGGTVWDDQCTDSPLTAGTNITLTRGQFRTTIAASGGGVTINAVDLTGQTADTAITTIITPGANGFYRMEGIVTVTTVGTTGCATPKVIARFTDADSNQAQGDNLLDMTAGDNIISTCTVLGARNVGDVVFYAKSGVAIQYSVSGGTYTGGLIYAARIRLWGPY